MFIMGGKGNKSITTDTHVVLMICVCLPYLEPTGLHGMGVTHDPASSCLIIVRSGQGTKLCGTLITYDDRV